MGSNEQSAYEIVLSNFQIEESQERMSHREKTVSQLESIVQNWMKDQLAEYSAPRSNPSAAVSVVGGSGSGSAAPPPTPSTGATDSDTASGSGSACASSSRPGRVMTFGSYRLGVCSAGSDVDVLVVAPRQIARGLFFTSFVETLRQQPEVADIQVVPNAYVPVIKCVFRGIALDIVYAQLSVSVIPEDFDIFDDRHLRNIDHKSVLSLNGRRVTERLLRLVPDVASFRKTLHVIKFWAKRKGVYSNAFGYLGGVSWAILVARVCQLHRTEPPESLVQHFFHLYATWKWPTPVALTPIYWTGNGSLDARMWSGMLKRQPAPILTPAYPFANTAANVTETTLRALQQEFSAASEILRGMVLPPPPPLLPLVTQEQEAQETLERNQSSAPRAVRTWRQVLGESSFFDSFPYFLCISICSCSKEEQLEWVGWVASRIRLLNNKLPDSSSVVRFRPFARIFNCATHEEPFANSFFVGVDFPPKARFSGPIDVQMAIRDFEFAVCETYHKRTSTMLMHVNLLKASQLPDYVFTQSQSQLLDGDNTSVLPGPASAMAPMPAFRAAAAGARAAGPAAARTSISAAKPISTPIPQLPATPPPPPVTALPVSASGSATTKRPAFIKLASPIFVPRTPDQPTNNTRRKNSGYTEQSASISPRIAGKCTQEVPFSTLSLE